MDICHNCELSRQTIDLESMNLVSSFGLSLNLKPNLSHFHSLFKHCSETNNPKRALLVFRELLEYNAKPNELTFALLLKGCVSCSSSSNSRLSPVEANQVHAHLIKSGSDRIVHIGTALLDFYSKLGCLASARELFDGMCERDVVCWNVLICGFSRNGCHFDALCLFVQMLREGFSPCPATLVSLVPSCGRRELVFQGKVVHGFGIKTGLGLSCRVQNALVSMYAKCGDLEAATCLFQEIVHKSLVSWNTMIGGFGQNGFFNEAVLVFKKMREENVEANPVTMVCLLSSNANPELTHCYVIKTGLANDFSVITSLVCEYARRGNSGSAEVLYVSFPQKNLVALTAIIASHSEKGNMLSVMEHFYQMQQSDMKPDAVTMVSILHGISDPKHFCIGLAFHGYGFKTGLNSDNLFANGLISMYSKFDQIELAFPVFSELSEKSLISWNSLMSGCVQAGRSIDAFELFSQMKMSGHNPDPITVASLLSGCGQLGYLQFGERLHNHVLRNNMEIKNFVGTALIDMYTKCGRIDHAEKVFKTIKQPCLATWNSMISGFSLYGQEHKALSCFSEMRKQELNPDRITFLGVLAACNHGGLVHEGKKHFKIMRKEYNMAPGLQHYACMVGLLGRAGLFNEALVLIKDMEVEPDFAVWGALLNACCIHQEVKLGEYLAKKLFLLDNRNGGFYVLMSNLYAIQGRWDDVAKVREMMRETGGDGCSGISVIEVTSFEGMKESFSSKVGLSASLW